MSLYKLGPQQLTDLGGALGLSYPKVRRMANSPDDVIAAWLDREDQVIEKSGEPTWSRLVDALEKIGQRGIAEEIRNNKCCGKTDITPSKIEGKFCKTIVTVCIITHIDKFSTEWVKSVNNTKLRVTYESMPLCQKLID